MKIPLLFACAVLGAGASIAGAAGLAPGTNNPASRDFSSDQDKGQSRDPIDTLQLVKDALLKYGGSGLPDFLDLSYNEQWAGVSYDNCADGITEGGSPAAAQNCGDMNVIAAGRDLFTMTGDCERSDVAGTAGGAKPKQIDGIAFVLAHEMSHLASRDPQEIKPMIANECVRWADSSEAEVWRKLTFLPEKEKLSAGGALSADAKKTLYLMLIKACVEKNKAGISAIKVRMEDQADAHALVLLSNYNQNARLSNGKAPFASFNLYGGGCAMRKLRDLEWVYAEPGQQASGDTSHADALSRAKKLDEIAKNVLHAP